MNISVPYVVILHFKNTGNTMLKDF